MLAWSATALQNHENNLFSLTYHCDHSSLLYHYKHKFKKYQFKPASSSFIICQVVFKRAPEVFFMMNLAKKKKHFTVISKKVLNGMSRRSPNFQTQREYYCLEKCIVTICSHNFLPFLSQCYFRHSNPYLLSAAFP